MTDTIKQPSRLLIIGNGFDLNLGLDTSYSHFLKSTCFNDLQLQNNIIADSLSQQFKVNNWIDIEKHFKILSKHYTSDLEKDFYTLCTNLENYLGQIDYANLNLNSKAYHLINDTIGRNYKILDFNYTKSTKLLLRQLGVSTEQINKRHVKVHGSIEDKNIIFGVEDKAEIKPEHIFFKKSFNKNFKPIKLMDEVDQFTELHIFGHSLGETDHTYFDSFFHPYSENVYLGQLKKIFLYHYGDTGYKELMIQIDKLTNHRLTKFKQNTDFNIIDTSQ
jgi:hypothetical protein